jgi:hypothetical protein
MSVHNFDNLTIYQRAHTYFFACRKSNECFYQINGTKDRTISGRCFMNERLEHSAFRERKSFQFGERAAKWMAVVNERRQYFWIKA